MGQKWVRVPLDDLPLIRPPRHHMLAHITGGLTNLYEIVKKNQEQGGSKQEDKKENEQNGEKAQKEDPNSEAHLDNDLSKKDEDDGIEMKENEDGDHLDAEKSEK